MLASLRIPYTHFVENGKYSRACSGTRPHDDKADSTVAPDPGGDPAVGCGLLGKCRPSAMQTTTASRAALLARNYALTITVDDRCSNVIAPTWTYRARLTDEGGYVTIHVVGGGYTESTDVGQVYTFPDFTARFIWNFDYADFNYPKPPTNALLLYGSSE